MLTVLPPGTGTTMTSNVDASFVWNPLSLNITAASESATNSIIEGLGSTEANYGITNADNRTGSVGRLPYPKATNIWPEVYTSPAGPGAQLVELA